MSRPVLVDSSWYISKSREGKDPLKALSLLAESRDVATCGIIKCEVGRGLSDPNRLARFQQAWEVMLYVNATSTLWDKTLSLAWSLDRRGILLPIQDIHIATCADHIGAVILTYDKHFQQIPGIDATDVIY